MRCHYEVLELVRSCSSEDIKKAYKKLSLKWHPDKNVGNEEAATEMFKEISSAYAVLSDKNERKWYDDHRESILRGNTHGKGEVEEDEYFMNLFPYFTRCYDGFNTDDNGFYRVYADVFNRIIELENAGIDREGNQRPYIVDHPPFGDETTHPKEVLKFYNYWTNFLSVLSFSWEDEHNPNDVTFREMRRAIEKENKKLRDNAKKKYVETVRSLALYVKRRDERVKLLQQSAASKKAEELALKEAKKKEKKEKKRQWRLSAMEEPLDEDERARRENEQKGAFLLADHSDEEVDVVNYTIDDDDDEGGPAQLGQPVVEESG